MSDAAAAHVQSNFEYAVERTLEAEGVFSNTPGDPGGKTKYGITEATWVAFQSKPVRPIEYITKNDALKIYRVQYWESLGLDAIKDRDVAAEIFDTAVNCGVTTAARIAQRAYNALLSSSDRPVAVDGHIGIVTRRCLDLMCDAGYREALITAMNVLQGEHYFDLVEHNPALSRFTKGWIAKRCRVYTGAPR